MWIFKPNNQIKSIAVAVVTTLLGMSLLTISCHPATDVATTSAMPPPATTKGNCAMEKAIVTLSYDDSLQSQLDNAIPALNARNLRGTFFIKDVSAQPAPWKAALASGHELASHTNYHPCTAQFDWVEAGYASEDYTPARMADEMDSQIEMLLSLGAAPPFTFAYPCGTTWIGKEQQSYVPLVEERFIAARGVAGDIVTRLETPMNVPAYFLEGPLEAFVGSASAAIADSGWVVFGFHGVGGDYLPVSVEDHNGFLDWLVEHRTEIEVMPFGEAAQCMARR